MESQIYFRFRGEPAVGKRERWESEDVDDELEETELWKLSQIIFSV